MIDAYEIGIQLALQDDVSGGLEVIGRELAEVDRAIAATSAHLANLTQVAQVSAGAATTGASMRPRAPVGEQTADDRHDTGSEVAEHPAKDDNPGSAPVSLGAAPRAEGQAGEISAAPAAPMEVQEKSATQPAVEAAPAVAAAPLRQPDEPAAADRATVAQPLEWTASVAPTGAASSEMVPQMVAEQRGASEASTVMPSVLNAQPRVSSAAAPPNRNRHVFTASVAGSMAPVSDDRQVSRVVDWAPSSEDASMGASTPRPAAPWTGSEVRGPSPQGSPPAERAAAPQSRSTERENTLNGAVMLDGRLVGYWVAEQLAKEASRPPSGTSFFDPRQTPAWTASGSL